MSSIANSKAKIEAARFEQIEGISCSQDIVNVLFEYPTITTNKKITYYNIPAAFDIETSSFYTNGEKAACMYLWSFGVNGNVIIGRTWDEFILMMHYIVDALQLGINKRLVVYVHNLAHEFQWMRKWFTWDTVFAVKERKVVKALTDSGIEFRCSYILSNCSLAELSGKLLKYPCQKMVGDLDYRLIRHTKTPIKPKELKYSENDVRVVMSYIQECIEDEGSIDKIPLTNTGYVRRFCRNSCYYNEVKRQSKDKYYKYHKLMQSLTMQVDEYKTCRRAFQGGFTHPSAYHSGKVKKNVASLDITSSYPTVMISEQFPMSKGEYVTVLNDRHFEYLIENYACIFDITFYGLCASQIFENPLSYSHCSVCENPIINNGRIVSCDMCITTITEVDFNIFKKFYVWDKIEVKAVWRYYRGYLPTDFVKSILKMYNDKTKLKGVDGAEADYMRAKGMLNSAYGMACQDPCTPELVYEDEWKEPLPVDYDEAIAKYNYSRNRFTFYPWSLYVTAHARYRLFNAILECGADYIYSDTDSVKTLNFNRHKDYFIEADKNITERVNRALTHHGIPIDEACPMTVKGEKKPLGVWEYECDYKKFKCLRAKAYMFWKKDCLKIKGKRAVKKYNVSLTVSGINKSAAIPYLINKYGYRGIFDAFTDELYIPPEKSGKLTHTYIDEEMRGIVTDYLGNTAEYHEYSAVHLEPSEYNLSLSYMYINYLKGFREW